MSKEIMDYGFGVIETRERFYTEQCVNKLNKRIAELEEQLANSIRPEFKIGQDVYVVSSGDVYVITIDSITIEKEENYTDFVYYDVYGIGYDWVFATKEDALAKLEELKGE